jgi:hypothetical protein
MRRKEPVGVGLGRLGAGVPVDADGAPTDLAPRAPPPVVVLAHSIHHDVNASGWRSG